jgi:hypothetical protein
LDRAEHCASAVASLRTTIPADGRLLIVEAVLPERDTPQSDTGMELSSKLDRHWIAWWIASTVSWQNAQSEK